jgi:hypothetical protein
MYNSPCVDRGEEGARVCVMPARDAVTFLCEVRRQIVASTDTGHINVRGGQTSLRVTDRRSLVAPHLLRATYRLHLSPVTS